MRLTTRARPHVLMLTTFDLDEYVYEGRASGFVLKDAITAKLIHAVKIPTQDALTSHRRPGRPRRAADGSFYNVCWLDARR
jgi:hypothetical protein